MKSLLLFVASALAVAAFSQTPSSGSIGIRIGYGTSGEFSTRSNSRISLTGPEFAVSVPILSQGGYTLAIEPSYLAAGRILKSAHQGDVFRFMLTAWRNDPAASTYFKVGIGGGHGASQSALFASQDGFIAQFGVGFRFGSGVGFHRSSVELNYFASGEGQLSGLFVGFTTNL